MLLMTRDESVKTKHDELKSSIDKASPYTKVSPYLPSTRRITEFQAGLKDPKVRKPIIY
jgi:hypothetical protein